MLSGQMNKFISFIIVTYQREKDALVAIGNVLQQQGNFEIIIIDNDPSSNVESQLPNAENIRYFKQQTNLGCGGGRNAGARLAKGQYMVFLDDDAEFKTNDIVLKVGDYFDQNPHVGCLAFHIRNYFTNEIDTKEFPHPNPKLFDQQMNISYYVGAGHAIRKAVFEKIGPIMEIIYREELDYAFRMIKNGYTLLYAPHVVVLHKVSTQGRSTNKKFIYYNVRNRYLVLANHLPIYYLIVNITLWNVVWFYRGLKIWAMKDFFSGLYEGSIYLLKTIFKGRSVLKKQQLSYLKKNGGRLWY
jgi:GT2 family glycosyltransferase